MIPRTDGLSPDAPVDAEQAEIAEISRFWDKRSIDDETGVTTREVLDEIERQVTDCLYQRPPDIPRARSLTARALLLIAGMVED